MSLSPLINPAGKNRSTLPLVSTGMMKRGSVEVRHFDDIMATLFPRSARLREGFIVLIPASNLACSQRLSNIVLSANASVLHSNFHARGWGLEGVRKYILAATSKTQDRLQLIIQG